MALRSVGMLDNTVSYKNQRPDLPVYMQALKGEGEVLKSLKIGPRQYTFE